jgi:hypothetical protein
VKRVERVVHDQLGIRGHVDVVDAKSYPAVTEAVRVVDQRPAAGKAWDRTSDPSRVKSLLGRTALNKTASTRGFAAD